MDAARLDRQLGALQRAHATVALADALHGEEAHWNTSPGARCFTGAASARPELDRRTRAYLFASLWPMISCAVKLMPQVGNELPTKKLSESLA